MKRTLSFSLLLAALPVAASAQDQVVLINGPLTVCADVLGAESSMLDPAGAEAAIRHVFNTDPVPGRYYLIHAVSYTGGEFVVGSQHWYVYHWGWFNDRPWWATLTEPDVQEYFEGTRVFGSSDVAVVYLHNGVPVATIPDLVQAATLGLGPLREPLAGNALESAIQAELKLARQRDPEIAQQAESALFLHPTSDDQWRRNLLVGLEGGNRIASLLQNRPGLGGTTEFVDHAGTPLERLTANLAVPVTFKSLATLAYRISITKKMPEPLQHLEAIASIAVGQAEKTPLLTPTPARTLCGGGAFSVGPLPSDMKVQAQVGGGEKPKEIGSETFDNERRYHVDFSFALPLQQREDLTIDVDERTVTAKKIDKADLFAVINLSPMPIDTKRLQAQYLPRLIYGMPVTGKPLQHHLLGLAVGLNRFQLFAGYRWDRNEEVSVESTDGADPVVVGVQTGAKDRKWSRTFVWGLNIPVSTIVKAIGAKK